MIIFWIVFGIDAVAALAIFYFFLEGLGDGSVSSFNMTLWLALLGGVVAVLGGGWALNAKGKRGAAIGVLAILGIPALLFVLFFLVLLVTQPNWH